ncbi:MAG TPA: hypothetical protein VGH72_06955 [Pseudonocardia sp.]|jgi:hypothetical protein
MKVLVTGAQGNSGDSAASKQWGALAVLAVTVLVVAQQLRRGQTFDALIIEIGSGVFLVALVALAFAAPTSGCSATAPRCPVPRWA